MNIWWIRRDLRLGDNPALSAALQEDSSVLPVFILDEHLLAKTAEKRHAFLFAGLRMLEADLKRLGSGLVVRRGNPVIEIPRLIAECNASAVFAEQDISPYALRRDAAIERRANLRLIHGMGIFPPDAVKRTDGGAYTVFTPYSQIWKNLPFGEGNFLVPVALPAIPKLDTLRLPDLPAPVKFPPGEREALRRLGDFINYRIYRYTDDRNRLDIEGTSTLSPYIRFGMLSARRVAIAAKHAILNAPDAGARAGCETFLDELIWRDFYQSITFHFPEALKTAFNPAMRNIEWHHSAADLLAWQGGYTGYPVVDAAMRQLDATGWMHNRARMITSSFLTKHLLINWQEGERWFMRMLVDGDPSANNGGWQWAAGTGTNAAPYFRIFNPILQGEKFDPQGEYVRRWVPELANVPQKFIHKPWEMPISEQIKSGVVIGRNYPAPIVEHKAARLRALEAYSKNRS